MSPTGTESGPTLRFAENQPAASGRAKRVRYDMSVGTIHNVHRPTPHGEEPPKPARPSLRRNVAWTGLANAVYAGCQWAILVALAKAGSAEMVGQFALGLAVTAPVFMFANLQLRSLQATDAKEQYAFADYLGLRVLGVVIAQCAVSAS